jgi:uncharacterized protein (UPF0335 family)
MNDIDTEKLGELLAFIDRRFDEKATPATIIQELTDGHGAVYKTDGAGNTIRLAGVGGSCSWSATDGVLASWRRNAEKRAKPGMGHNSRASASDDRLRLLIERVERLEEEKKGIADDIRDVYAEASAVGYDAKIMRQIVRLRKMKPDDRAEMEAILDVYKAAVGLG